MEFYPAAGGPALGNEPVSADKFIQSLTDSGLLSRAEVQELLAQVPAPRRGDGRFLAQELVRRHKLTRYQAAMICQGQGRGLLLGNYVILDKLGQGGMGMVFLVEDPQLRRQVALKVMLPEVARDEEYRQRFLREAQAMAAVKDDHIVTIYQVGQDNEVPYLAMEFLQGTPLDKWMERGRKLTTAQLLRLAREMARGLSAAHKQGLIHRDIKPANIWLEAPIGRVKILDFGLARPVQMDDCPLPSNDQTIATGPARRHLTQAGTIMGTPAYMAPEQARGETVDSAATCSAWAVCCTSFVPAVSRSTARW